MDIYAEQAFINGRLLLGGTEFIDDLGNVYVQINGIYNTSSYGGYAWDMVDPQSGEYGLVVSQGSWQPGNFNLQFQSEPGDEEYLNQNLYFYDYRLTPISIGAGETINKDLTYNLGAVTVIFRVLGGTGVLSNPWLDGQCYKYNESGQQEYYYSFYSYSSGQNNVEEGRVTFVGLGGTVTVNAWAYVEGSYTKFGTFQVEVVPGAEVEIDIGAPTLNVEFPEPGYITSDSSITVTGTAEDAESAVASVTVNGIEAALTPTGPTENPYKSVEFSATISLERGANEIVTVASDTADPANEATDRRTVYRDDGPPSLTWTPEDGLVTSSFDITVEGTATDDNGIKSITVNGIQVPFESTGNPDDPNEVSFSTSLTLQEGDNLITVTAIDIYGRVTSETHTVTVSENQPPVANAGEDQTIEQDTRGGASVTLDGSASSDPDGDLLTFAWTWSGGSASGVTPTVTLPLGTTTVTLVVNDGTVDSAPDTVDITVVDTTAPDLTIPDDVTVEQETADGTVVQLRATATDVCDADVEITSDAPEIFPLGETVVTFTAIDDSGNSISKSMKVIVVDTTAPELSVTLSTTNLWPANHKYVTVTIEVTASDICDADVANQVQLVSVTSDEPEDVAGKNNKEDGGDGNTLEDIVIVDKNTVQLRAERLGGSDGRVYTLNYRVTDASGNTSTVSVIVTVEHNPGEPAVDSGVKYTVTP